MLKNYKLSQYLDFQPYIEDRSRNDILDIDDDENDYLFMEKYMNIYQKIKNKIKLVDINKTINEIVTIIKQNYKSNIEKLNRDIIELIKIDDDYTKTFM